MAASPPLLILQDIRHSLGTTPLLDGANRLSLLFDSSEPYRQASVAINRLLA